MRIGKVGFGILYYLKTYPSIAWLTRSHQPWAFQSQPQLRQLVREANWEWVGLGEAWNTKGRMGESRDKKGKVKQKERWRVDHGKEQGMSPKVRARCPGGKGEKGDITKILGEMKTKTLKRGKLVLVGNK